MPISWLNYTSRAARAALAASLLAGAGCTAVGPPVQPDPATGVPEPVAEAAPAGAGTPAVATTPQRHEVVILSNGTPAHREVATLLEQSLSRDGYHVWLHWLDDDRPAPGLAALGARPNLLAIAVGHDAATNARETLRVPTVFCQVFNYAGLLDGPATMWGVSSIPPLELLLGAWRELDPRLRELAIIVGEEHAALAHEAERAARGANVSVRIVTSTSDRETLYLFRRLAREVDGLWLFPDNRILSPAVIAELSSYAASHGVQIHAVNAALPPETAVISTTGTAADIARAVAAVLGRLVRGEADGLPSLSPLSEARVEVDPRVAARLGLSAPRPSAWVVR